MNGRRIAITPSAYAYPLLIKQLLYAPLMQAPKQEIVYRDLRRLTYGELRDRIGRLASALAKIRVRPGDTVGVLDWDSNRFLEAFFAIPMMGAVLQTVNVRLSLEQIGYTRRCSSMMSSSNLSVRSCPGFRRSNGSSFEYGHASKRRCWCRNPKGSRSRCVGLTKSAGAGGPRSPRSRCRRCRLNNRDTKGPPGVWAVRGQARFLWAPIRGLL